MTHIQKIVSSVCTEGMPDRLSVLSTDSIEGELPNTPNILRIDEQMSIFF